MTASIRHLATVGHPERQEIVRAALLQNEGQMSIARRHNISRSSVAQLVFQHRQAVKAGHADPLLTERKGFRNPTIRRFSWEGAEA